MRLIDFLIALVTGWRKYFGLATGIMGQGDLNVPPTTLLNLVWLRSVVWKKVAVLRIPKDKAKLGYRIGYRPFKGPSRLKIETLHQELIGVVLGHEDCTFFAENMLGDEIELLVEKLTTKDDPELRHVRLI